MPSLTQQLREAKEQVRLWQDYSRSRTAERKHETLHAIVMAACWRARVRRLKNQLQKGKRQHARAA